MATPAAFKAWYAKVKALKLEGDVLSELGRDMHSKGSLPQWPPTGAPGALQKGQLLVKLAEAGLKIDDISTHTKYNGLDDDWWQDDPVGECCRMELWYWKVKETWGCFVSLV